MRYPAIVGLLAAACLTAGACDPLALVTDIAGTDDEDDEERTATLVIDVSPGATVLARDGETLYDRIEWVEVGSNSFAVVDPDPLSFSPSDGVTTVRVDVTSFDDERETHDLVLALGGAPPGVDTADEMVLFSGWTELDLRDGDEVTVTAVAEHLLSDAIELGRISLCGLGEDATAYCRGEAVAIGGYLPVSGLAPNSAVPGGHAFAEIAAGMLFACGVTTEGEGYCWGVNDDGQLGDGTTGIRSAPVPVAGGLEFGVLSASEDATCGITTERVTYCWGYVDWMRRPFLEPAPIGGGIAFD